MHVQYFIKNIFNSAKLNMIGLPEFKKFHQLGTYNKRNYTLEYARTSTQDTSTHRAGTYNKRNYTLEYAKTSAQDTSTHRYVFVSKKYAVCLFHKTSMYTFSN